MWKIVIDRNRFINRNHRNQIYYFGTETGTENRREPKPEQEPKPEPKLNLTYIQYTVHVFYTYMENKQIKKQAFIQRFLLKKTFKNPKF